LTSYQQRLVVRSTQTGQVLHELDTSLLAAGERAFFPEFSPDDKKVVVTLAAEPNVLGQPLRQFAVTRGRIAVLDFQDGAFPHPPRSVVPETQEWFHYYPTWSPDGRWLAFVSAPRSDGRDSYGNPAARLRMVPAEGGPIYELRRISGSASSWPKFLPALACPVDAACEAEPNLLFLSFTSKRDYGLLLPNSRLAIGERRPQVWFAAIDLERLLAGEEGAAAPLWIPTQRFDESHHSGSWASAAACTTDDQCAAGETCRASTAAASTCSLEPSATIQRH
jgi:hypothetical protein